MSGTQGSEDSDHFNDIAGYFSKEAFEKLMDWEKVRYKNIKRNYEAMVAIGLDVPKPEFMTNRSRRRPIQVDESSESDEDWTPKLLTKNPQRFKIFGPFKNENGKNSKRKPVIKVTSYTGEDKRDLGGATEETKEGTVLVKRIKRATVVSTRKTLGSASEEMTKETEKISYNLRNKERILYTEEGELCDDDYLCTSKVTNLFLQSNHISLGAL
ncbi:histone-lysine N-methyltransferase PRDM7-like isoform X2 [Leucoraja erinacea]|uniref:histone-lysine N-methyltransferase PRDM7-like isoform X2 n=1 Tax=Leucoraja erinaceus TaxID=7782 RepID=UPI002457FB47|nr:histone-lysine N-methyltransferase PRDM7-like isoform X2 [Leucoraja erinacea]